MINMNQPYQQLDPKVIETLKAARNQVVQAVQNRNEDEQKINVVSSMSVAQKNSKGSAGILVAGFAEEFLQKLASIEKETSAVDEEIAKMEKIWLNLVEKKKQLENRRSELIKVKDKLKELDKEMSSVLESQQI